MQKSLYLLFGLLFLIASELSSQKIIPLHENWTIQTEDQSVGPLPATVPGVVQADLIAQKVIPDPYWGTNEDSIQWVGQKNWIYTTSFDVPDLNKKSEYELRFEGLDTYAEVFLNGKSVLKADNMFRQWKVEISKIIKAQNNQLEVRFKAPEKCPFTLSQRRPPLPLNCG